MGLNIKHGHGLIDEQHMNNIAGLPACRYICLYQALFLLLNRKIFAPNEQQNLILES